MKKSYSALLLAFFLCSCIDQIDLVTPAGFESLLAIEGNLIKSDSTTTISVAVSRLYDFTVESREYVNVESVFLFDNLGNSIKVKQSGFGVYSISIENDHELFPIKIGNTYYIQVNTIDGRTFESSPEPLLEVPQPERILVDTSTIKVEGALEKLVDQKVISFSIETPLRIPGSTINTRLQWALNYTYRLRDRPPLRDTFPKTCYITEEAAVNQIKIYDGPQINGTFLPSHPIYETNTGLRFARSFYLSVFQRSLSPGAYDYLNKVRQSVERTGSMFETPPGPAGTNLRNVTNSEEEVLGYFYAAEEKVVRVKVDSLLAGLPSDQCRDFFGRDASEYPTPACRDCLWEEINSTLKKPDWWIE